MAHSVTTITYTHCNRSFFDMHTVVSLIKKLRIKSQYQNECPLLLPKRLNPLGTGRKHRIESLPGASPTENR